MKKGMIVDVYRANGHDCSMGGISSKHEAITITGPGIPEIEEPSEKYPEMIFEPNANRVDGNLALYPPDSYSEGKRVKWYMFGGNFAWSSDSRFPSAQPIKIHDRHEP